MTDTADTPEDEAAEAAPVVDPTQEAFAREEALQAEAEAEAEAELGGES